MSKSERELIVELEAVLIGRRYSLVVIRNYCSYAREFLGYLMHRGIPVADVTEAEATAQQALARSTAVRDPRAATAWARSMAACSQSSLRR